MEGSSRVKYVIRWKGPEGTAPSALPYLKVVRRFHPEKRRSVEVDEWEAEPHAATSYLSIEDALAAWDRLGLGKREYIEVEPV